MKEIIKNIFNILYILTCIYTFVHVVYVVIQSEPTNSQLVGLICYVNVFFMLMVVLYYKKIDMLKDDK